MKWKSTYFRLTLFRAYRKKYIDVPEYFIRIKMHVIIIERNLRVDLRVFNF